MYLLKRMTWLRVENFFSLPKWRFQKHNQEEGCSPQSYLIVRRLSGLPEINRIIISLTFLFESFNDDSQIASFKGLISSNSQAERSWDCLNSSSSFPHILLSAVTAFPCLHSLPTLTCFVFSSLVLWLLQPQALWQSLPLLVSAFQGSSFGPSFFIARGLD